MPNLGYVQKALEIVAVAKTNPSSGPVNAKGPIVPSKTSAFSWVLAGVNIRGAGGGKPFMQGEIGGWECSGQGELLSNSLSGDSQFVIRNCQ